MSGAGVSVVIPFGGAARLPLLAAVLASLNGKPGVDQIIVAEYAEAPLAVDTAAAVGADYVFLPGPPPFDKSRAMNAGDALARCAELLWYDGDLLLCADFIPRALAEFRAGGFDFLFPYSHISYLSEADTIEVIAGRRAPASCETHQVVAPIHGVTPEGVPGEAPGGMGLVRRDFLERHGGMIEGFRGWGMEDNAWLHKAALLGRVGASARRDQAAWHLFHADSGSHSLASMNAVVAANPRFAANAALLRRVATIRHAATFTQHFPPPAHATAPWPVGMAPCFLVADTAASSAVARAASWSARIGALYGAAPALVSAVGNEAIAAGWRGASSPVVACFADDRATRDALIGVTGHHATVLVPAPRDRGAGATPRDDLIILAADAAHGAAWAARGFRVWHRGWRDGETEGHVPVIVQPLSQLGAVRRWDIRIVLDHATLGQPALEYPRFWYVGLHSHDGVELHREDADRREIMQALDAGDGRIVMARQFEAFYPPASWTVWPVDRHGRWLDRIVGPVDADCLNAD